MLTGDNECLQDSYLCKNPNILWISFCMFTVTHLKMGCSNFCSSTLVSLEISRQFGSKGENVYT